MLPLSSIKDSILDVIASILAVAWVILKDILPLSTFKASILDVIASILAVACVILKDKLPLSITKASILDVIASILAVACVILNERLPLSTFKASILAVACVIRVSKLELSATKLIAVTSPSTSIDPVNSWVSSEVSPNFVLPLVNIIEALSISVCISWAVNLPCTTTSLWNNASSLPVILLKRTLLVVPNDCISPSPSKKVVRDEKLPLSTFKASILEVIASILAVACVILNERLPLSVFNADILDVIAWILEVACVILVEKLPLSVSILNEKLPLSVFNADILEVMAWILAVACVIFNDILAESTFKASILEVIASILAVACVILVEKLPLSTFKALILEVMASILAVACVILVDIELDTVDMFETDISVTLNVENDPNNEPLIFPLISRCPLAVILPLALMWPSAVIFNLSEPAVKNFSSSLSAPAEFSAVIFVSWSTSFIPPSVPQLEPS